MSKKQPSRLSAFLGHKITQDVLSKLVVAAVLAFAKAMRDSKRVRRQASRLKHRISVEASVPTSSASDGTSTLLTDP
jgi:hypothetical protein